jgi:hypothetical protein
VYDEARAEYETKERELNDKAFEKATSDYNDLTADFDANEVLYKAQKTKKDAE